MADLRVNITGDATSFNKSLEMAKTNAAKFNQQLVAQGRVVAESNKRTAQVGMAATRGIAVANAASQLGGVPGMGQAGNAVASAAGAFWGLKEVATSFKMSMGLAGAHLAAFAVAVAVGMRIWEEGNKAVKALKEETETMVRANRAERKTKDMYLDVLKQNRSQLKAGEFEKLASGVAGGDRGAMAEIRKRFGGTVLNKELQKELVKAQIEAMPEGYRKSVAEERMRYSEEVAGARARIGDTPSTATQQIGRQILGALAQEHNNRMLEIQQRQLKELQGIKSNTTDAKQYSINPFK